MWPPNIRNRNGDAALLLICEHASYHIPEEFGDLGLSAAELTSHIAWDPGAALVAQGVADRLDAPLAEATVSRLIVDCNRPPASPHLIAKEDDGIIVPGNHSLSQEDVDWRLEAVHTPFHKCVSDQIDFQSKENSDLKLVSIHSFTPVYGNEQRPWRCGVLRYPDDAFAHHILRQLQDTFGPLVGDNKPYAPDPAYDFTMPFHAQRRGLPHVLIEIRNDELLNQEGIAFWQDTLADAIQSVL